MAATAPMKNMGYHTSVRVQAQPVHKAWVARARPAAPARRGGLVSLRSSSETLEQRLDRVEVEMLRLAMGQPLGNGQLAGSAAPTAAAATMEVSLEQRVLQLEQELLKLQQERNSLENITGIAPEKHMAQVLQTLKLPPDSAMAQGANSTWAAVGRTVLLKLLPSLLVCLIGGLISVQFMRAYSPRVLAVDFMFGAVLWGLAIYVAVLAFATLLESLHDLLMHWKAMCNLRRPRRAVPVF